MFLIFLTEEEKEQYLNLAVIAANTNGSLEEDEKEMINGYLREMNISLESTELCSNCSEDYVFRFFSASERSHKKIVLFEIIGLLACDRSFDEDEKRFVLRLSKAIGLSSEEVDAISQLALQYFDIVVEIASNIFVDQ